MTNQATKDVYADFNRIRPSQFSQRLSHRLTENVADIHAFDRYVLTKRDDVVKSPQRGESIILLVSGGIDSTVLWETLLSRGINVYPLYVYGDKTRGNGVGSRRAIHYFADYFGRKYPVLSKPLRCFDVHEYPRSVWREYRRLGPGKFYHYRRIIDHYKNGNVTLKLLPNTIFQYPVYGLMYSYYLFNRFNLSVTTILTGLLPSDGITIPGQTLTHTRFYQQMLLLLSGDKSIHYYAPFFEPQLGIWMDKEAVIKLGIKYQLPLTKTWSCTEGFRKPCGECDSCLQRNVNFQHLQLLHDKTESVERFIVRTMLPDLKLHLGLRQKILKLARILIRKIKN